MHRIVTAIVVGILLLTLAPAASAVTDAQFNALKRKVNTLQRQVNQLQTRVRIEAACLQEVSPFALLGVPPTEGYLYEVQGQAPVRFPAFTLDVRTTHDADTYWVQLVDPGCIENARIAADKRTNIPVQPQLLRSISRW